MLSEYKHSLVVLEMKTIKRQFYYLWIIVTDLAQALEQQICKI